MTQLPPIIELLIIQDLIVSGLIIFLVPKIFLVLLTQFYSKLILSLTLSHSILFKHFRMLISLHLVLLSINQSVLIFLNLKFWSFQSTIFISLQNWETMFLILIATTDLIFEVLQQAMNFTHLAIWLPRHWQNLTLITFTSLLNPFLIVLIWEFPLLFLLLILQAHLFLSRSLH